MRVLEVVRDGARDYFRVYGTDLVGNGFKEGTHFLVERRRVGAAEVGLDGLQMLG